MDYRVGTLGRLFVIRFDDGDDFLAELINLAKKEDIRASWFVLIGGLRQAEVVTGPKETTVPPEPVWRSVNETQELLGIGSIYWDEKNEPKIHLHSALGHHGQSLTVCLRRGAKTYLVLECHLHEISNMNAARPWYPEGGFNRLTFS